MELKENVNLLNPPAGKVDVVLDTDAFNEIDDQYAISYLLASPDKVSIQAFYAAPFLNEKSESAKDGMEKSYQEILHLLRLAQREEYVPFTYRGSETFMVDERTPVVSDAATDLSKRAMQYTPEAPLYVLAIGAITNIASAIVMNPDIVSRIRLIWLGGHAKHWPHTKEFNLRQDVAAARIVFGCGVSLVQLPCCGVVEMLRTTGPELEYWLRGKSKLCDYLIDHTEAEANSYADGKPWSRVIWDISAVAWILNTNGKMMQQSIIPAPMPGYDCCYEPGSKNKHDIAYVWHINRDLVFESLFKRLADMK